MIEFVYEEFSKLFGMSKYKALNIVFMKPTSLKTDEYANNHGYPI